ncbi:MAG: sulfite exporter TauE/SafE family protein [Nitratireductor sp.]|nr:sulfite exporter TauE/SafE family protein [Nitratireductor sp.]
MMIDWLIGRLPSGMDFQTLVICLIVLGIAGYVRGFGGFGFSAITVAGAGMVMPLATVVPMAILLEIGASMQMAPTILRDVEWKRMTLLLAGGLIGNPVGISVLQFASSTMIGVFVYGFILLAALVLLVGKGRVLSIDYPGWFFVGLTAGVINGASALSGLFIVVMMSMSATSPATMRATLIAYFFASDVYAAVIMASRGMISGEVVVLALVALPVVGIAILFGSRQFIGTSEASFRRAVLLLLSFLGLAGLIRLAVQ